MLTVELLDAAQRAAAQLGIKTRQDWLGGGSAYCVLKGQPWLFLDLSDGPEEHLAIVLEALSGRAELAALDLPPALIARLGVRKRA
jgi:hypothetical protein